MLNLRDNETLLSLACALRYRDKIGQERAEVQSKVMACKGRKGGKVTAARRELARLASIGIKPITGR